MPLNDLDHRPWPPPAAPWVMAQTWYNLLFAQWPIPIETMRALVPPQLELDTFEGQAWVGVVPFGMARVYPRGMFPVPWLSRALFASYLRTNPRTLENWEQGRAKPNAQAALLIRLVAHFPDTVKRLATI